MLRCAAAVALLLLGCGPSLEERLGQARSLAEEGHFEEMVALLTPMHYEASDDPEFNHLYGLALLETENSGMAVWPLRKAATAPGREIEDGLLLARALARGAVPIDAIVALDRVLELAPERGEVWFRRAKVNRSLKRYEDMLSDCGQLLSIAKDRPQAILCRVDALSLLDRHDEAEQALSEGQSRLVSADTFSAAVERRFCSTSAELAHESGDSSEATKRWEACLESFPSAPELISGALSYFDELGDPVRGTRILEAAMLALPNRFDLISAFVERLEGMGRGDEAEDVLLDATKNPDLARRAWLALAEHYRQHDEFDEAIRATETALAENPSLPVLLLAQYGDDLIQAGEFAKANAVIEQLPDHPMVPFLRGRAQMLQGDPAGALETLEEGLLLWPGNPTARYLAGQAAETLGDIDRAIAEYRNALRAEAGHTDAAFDLARIHEAEGDFGSALIALAHRSRALPQEAETRLATLRVGRRAGRGDVVAEALQVLSELPDQQATFVVEKAATLRLQEGPRAAADVILEGGLDLDDSDNAEALAALVHYLIQTGAAVEALKRADGALRANPDEAALHEIRGTALVAAGRSAEESRSAYERALELDPTRASTLQAMAWLLAEEGATEDAIALYDKAQSLEPDRSVSSWKAIELIAAAGDDAELERRLTALLERNAIHGGAATLRAEQLLDQREDLDEAERLALLALRFGGGRRAVLLRGRVAVARGDLETGARVLRRFEALGPPTPSAWYELGLAYDELGDLTRAQSALREAVEAGEFAESASARRHLARLEESADG